MVLLPISDTSLSTPQLSFWVVLARFGQANKGMRFHNHSTAATNMVRVCEQTCRADVGRALPMIPISVDNQSHVDKAFQK